MSLDIRSASPADPVVYDDIRLQPNWRERVIVVVAASLAVLTLDKRLARFPLGVQRIEVLFETFFGGFSRIYRASSKWVPTSFHWTPASLAP